MIYLKDFTHLDKKEILLVWQWRNDEKISQFMKTKHIDFQEHLNFIITLKKDQTKKYFLVFKDNEAIGVIDFINITQDSCEFGLYAKPNLKGVGQILMQEIKKYAFEILKIKELKACVFKQNKRALSLYLKNDFYIEHEDKDMFYVKLKNTKKKNILRANPLKLIQHNWKNNNILLMTQNHQNNILLKNYINLNHIEKEKMRKYRNHLEVRRYLYQTHFISKLEHKNFIKKLKHNTKKSYFCVILGKQIIGHINFHIKENEIDFGFYANPFSRILGIGRILEQISIYYAFKIINTPILSLEIFSDNTQVINLHHKFGFKIIQESAYKNRKILKMSLNNPYCKTFFS